MPDSPTTPQAQKYQAMKHRLFLFQLVVNLLFLLALISTGWSRGLKIWLLGFQDQFFWINALYFACFSFLGFWISFPLDFYEGFVLEHKYGLSREGLGGYLKDVLKKSILVFCVSLIVVEALYFFLSEFPRTWWLWAALFWFFVSVVVARIFPKMILPLFFKSKSLEAGEPRARIFSLLKRHRVRLKDILVLDFSRKTVKANAMMAGLGSTKQIFLSDTLVKDFPADEVEVVVAHELGHYLHRDTLRLALGSLGSALLSFYAAALVLDKLVWRFGFQAASDIAGLPLLLLILMGASLMLLPAQKGFSRFLESQADDFSLRATSSPESLISALRRLGETNLAELSPSRLVEIFLYDHPPISKRIQAAQKYIQSTHGN